MNNRNKMIILAVILPVIIVGLIVLVVRMKPNDELSPTDSSPVPGTSAAATSPTEESTKPATQPTQTPETTAPTSSSETTMPSVETQPDDTDGGETKPVETKPDETKQEETEPEETEPEETEPEETKPDEQEKSPWDVTYEEYQNMSATEQRAQMESFGSIDEFFAWYDAAKKKHEAENPDIEVGGGDVVTPGGEN